MGKFSLVTIRRHPDFSLSSLYAFVLPSLLGLLVDVGQDVSSSAGSLTHHHWDGRALLKVFEYGQDHIRTPL